MYKALKISFKYFSESNEKDRLTSIYVPNILFINRNTWNGIIFSSDFTDVYEFFAGEEAEKRFEKFKKEAIDPKITKIKLPDSFVEWAMAVYKCQHPPKDVDEFLPHS